MLHKDSDSTNIKGKKRIFHLIIAVVFFALFISGAILYTPSLSGFGADSWSRLIHRIFASVLIGTIVFYTVINYRKAVSWFNSLALWTKNSNDNPDKWKRRHKALVTVGLAVLIITGSIQWFLKGVISSESFMVSIMIHDIAFIYVLVVLMLHLYHELDWWLWKKRYCSQCFSAGCARICPTHSISITPGKVIFRDGTCNNCRLCMGNCQKNLHYIKSKTNPEAQ